MMIVSIKYPTGETGNNVRHVPITTTTGVVCNTLQYYIQFVC